MERLAERFHVRTHRGPKLGDEMRVAEFVADAEGVIPLLANPIGEQVFQRCSSLRVVANCAVGFDNVDLDAANSRGIWVTNTPDVLTEATADLTWALILAVTRRLVEAERFLRDGRFEGWALDLLLGHGIQAQSIGIIGYGRIGRAVARRAVAFGMEVLYSDPEVHPEPDPPALRVDLEKLLPRCRVLSVHCPLTGATHHLLDERRLRLLPRGAFLVNTARGPVVDEAALVRVLEDGHLAGAGLDVFEHEPAVHPGLLARSDVVLLPHVGSATVQTRIAMADLAAANLTAVLEGREPPNPVVRGSG